VIFWRRVKHQTRDTLPKVEGDRDGEDTNEKSEKEGSNETHGNRGELRVNEGFAIDTISEDMRFINCRGEKYFPGEFAKVLPTVMRF
jgi:hypothetical protein